MAAAEPTIQTTTTVNCGGNVRFPDKETSCLVRVRSAGAEATAPTGTVKLAAEGGKISAGCTLLKFIGPESVCSGTYTTRVAGQQTISAGYVGSQTHLPSSGKTTVAVSDTATVLTCEPESTVDVGKSSTCTAEVKNLGAASNNVSGTVSFASNSEGLDRSSCTLGEGNACSVKFTPQVSGTHSITAAYGGDATHPASSAEVVIAARGITQTTVNCGSALRFPNDEVQCLVRIRSVGPEATAATGLVAIKAEGGLVAECKVLQLPFPEGLAVCPYFPVEAGVQAVTAEYTGDETHQPGSAQTTVRVSSTLTSMSCDRESLAVGESATCTAEVRNAGAASDSFSGTISFKSENEGRLEPSSCTVDRENNVCTVKYFPEVGVDHRVIATYSGDATHPAGVAEVPLTVRGPSIKLVCTPRDPDLGDTASCVARVVNRGLGAKSLTGTVRFESSSDGRFSPPVCTLLPFLNDGGFCSTTYTPEVVGAHFIHAVYSGDATHPRAIDSSDLVFVPKRPTTTSWSCERPQAVGANTQCTAHVRDVSTSHGTAPTGFIGFESDVEGSAQFTSCKLAAVNSVESTCTNTFVTLFDGSQLLTAVYGGDATHDESTASRRFIYPTTAEVDCGDSAVVGELKVCTATVRAHDVEPRPTEGAPTPPTGLVRFRTTGTGTFEQTSCSLSPNGPDTSTCSVSYRPQAAGSHPISVAYGPEPEHDLSFGTKDLLVRPG